jgi:hypothetical protein
VIDFTVAVFIFGAILFLIGIIGGGFEISAIKVPAIDRRIRIAATVAGLMFVALAFITRSSANQQAVTPSTILTPTEVSVDCSRPSGSSHDIKNPITFVNTTNRTVEVNWVNEQGIEVHYADLDPGKTSVQNTFLNHSWCVRDKQTKHALLAVISIDPNQTAIIH